MKQNAAIFMSKIIMNNPDSSRISYYGSSTISYLHNPATHRYSMNGNVVIRHHLSTWWCSSSSRIYVQLQLKNNLQTEKFMIRHLYFYRQRLKTLWENIEFMVCYLPPRRIITSCPIHKRNKKNKIHGLNVWILLLIIKDGLVAEKTFMSLSSKDKISGIK